MNIIKRITGLFSVMDEEVKSFRLLFLQSLFIGFANSYYYIVSSSFLLKNIKINNLPNAYIITGLAGFMLIKLYKSLQKKYGIAGSYKLAVFIFSLICILNFFAMLEFSTNKDFSIILAYFTVLFAAPFTTIFSLGLFAQCSRIFNMAQSKRLLALVVSGDIIASIIAYLSIPFLRELIQGHQFVLLPVAAGFILLVLIPLNKLAAQNKEKFEIAVTSRKPVKMDVSFFRKDKFFMLIAIATIFSVFAIYLVDYTYLVSVRYMSNITDIEIAEIVSVFFFLLKIGELVFSFLSGKILSNKGVKFSLLLLPVLLLLFSAIAFITGFLFNGIFLLSFLFISKLFERAIRKAITTPSVKVMYQVAEPHERLEIEANIDGLLNQVATIISGVLLLIISMAFFGNDMFALLHIFSFVCIIAFGLWSFFSLQMYESYRVKIKNFLSKIKSESHHDAHTGNMHAKKAANGNNSLRERTINAITDVRNAKKEDLINLIRIYNPKQSLDIAYEKEDVVIKRLVHIYYGNSFYFSRLLIIRYLQYCSEDNAFGFFKELWEVSDITARLELIIAFNEKTNKNATYSYFERLCEECVREITWVDATIFDTAELKDDGLEYALREHRSVLICLLFELLKPIYEPSVMQVTYDIISKDSPDVEDQLFALELLDITLQKGLKEMVKHTLEPTGFENKKQYLGKIFHIYHLSPKERLVDILMKDYNLTDPGLKETALVLYSKITDEKNVLYAFRSNSVENLRRKADEICTGVTDPLYQAKLEAITLLCDNFGRLKAHAPYLLNYAVFVASQDKSHPNPSFTRNSSNEAYILEIRSSANIVVRIDLLAAAILITLKQKPVNIGAEAIAMPVAEELVENI